MTFYYDDDLRAFKAALLAAKNEFRKMLSISINPSNQPRQPYVSVNAIKFIIIMASAVYRMELYALTEETTKEAVEKWKLFKMFDLGHKTKTLEKIHRQLINGRSINCFCDHGSTPQKTVENLLLELQEIQTDLLILENGIFNFDLRFK